MNDLLREESIFFYIESSGSVRTEIIKVRTISYMEILVFVFKDLKIRFLISRICIFRSEIRNLCPFVDIRTMIKNIFSSKSTQSLKVGRTQAHYYMEDRDINIPESIFETHSSKLPQKISFFAADQASCCFFLPLFCVFFFTTDQFSCCIFGKNIVYHFPNKIFKNLLRI